METEFRFHLDLRIDELKRQGLDRDQAEALAKREFGALDLAKEECRDQMPFAWLGDVGRDIRYAGRSIRRAPGFAITAVVTLALGIGANTAVFSLIHAVLLRVLPYPEPDRLVHVGERYNQAVSIPEYTFWKEQSKSFAAVAGYRGGDSQGVVLGKREEWAPTMAITADFFRTLGVNLTSGREFQPAETTPGGPRAAIISYRLWQSLGSGIGRQVTVGDKTYLIVGVVPAHFWFPQTADIFLPLTPTGSLADQGTNTTMLARLKPGMTFRQAESEMAILNDGFRRSNANRFASKDWPGLTITNLQTWLVGDVRLKLCLLFGAVGLLLFIAILNVASLILARLASRQKEIAIRRALGSSSQRLLRQFAVENILLSLCGGLAGVVSAHFLLRYLLRQIPFQLPSPGTIRLSWPVLAFTFALALLTGLLFTTAPLFASMRSDVFKTLRTAGQGAASGARQYVRGILVVGQVAFSVTLLVGAALLIQSLYRLNQESLGFSPKGVITFSTPPAPLRKQNAAELLLFENTLLKKLTALPGVRSAAAVNVLPLTGPNNFPTERAGHPDEAIGGMEIRLITPGYFDAMGIPVLRGRAFSSTDTNGASPVILVNETLARQWWAQANPLGDRVTVGRFHGQDYLQDATREVIGVVADTKTVYLKAWALPTVYLPIEQARWATWGMSWIVRANDVNVVARQLRQAVTSVDPHQPVADVRTLDEIVAATKAAPRFDAWLFGGFAALALLLTAVGLYGLLSFSVARRTNEMGTRLALGACPSDVLALILREGIKLVGIGLILGLAAALVLTRYLSSLLFGVHATDPASYWLVSLVLILVGALASYLPAQRAATLDPMTALRCE